MGSCPNIHDDNLRKQYEDSGKVNELGYERELELMLEKIIARNDKEISRALLRVDDEEGGSGRTATKIDLEDNPELAEISKSIEDKLKEAEEAGEEGLVAKSQALFNEAEALKRKKAELQAKLLQRSGGNEDGSGNSRLTQNSQKLRVCNVCSSFLSLLDSEDRLADHFGGRVHLGFAAIRAKYNDLKGTTKPAPMPNRDFPHQRGGDSGFRGREWERGGDRDHDRRRDRDFDRDRDRFRGRGRDRYGDDRSRGRDYGYDSRYRDRGGERYRSRSRDRTRY